MAQSIDFVKDRAVKTISAAKQVAATWTWQEKSIADMQAQLTAIIGNKEVDPPLIGQEEIVSATEQVMLNARGAWDTALDQLHRWTVQGLNTTKNKFRNDPAKSAQLAGLTASSSSRTGMLAEALDFESAWGNIDPNWVPLPALTFAAFKALRKSCNEDLQSAYADARADWRDEAEKLGQMARDMEDVNEAWYADATIAFPVGTSEGDMIRSTVPTTYVPSAEKKAAAPATAAPVK